MNSITPQEARKVSEEAYIFSYPILMGYKAIYGGAIDEYRSFLAEHHTAVRDL